MKLIPPLILLVLMSLSAFGQSAAENRKIDEIGTIYYCCDFGGRIYNASIEQQSSSGSRIYLVFYEGKKIEGWKWDAVTKTSKPALLNPPHNGFMDFKKGVLKRAMYQKIDTDTFVFIDGGFRETRTAEIWIVPEGNQPPEIIPTVDKKDVKYRRGSERRFSHICDNT